jgi:pimeloyl-ACP methyl ester carboxylesterase
VVVAGYESLEITDNALRHRIPRSLQRIESERRMTVDEGLFVTIHGVEQWVTIRGRDSTNPVLLLISGAGAALSGMAPLFAAWEREFTFVQWDQPAAGATQARSADAPAGDLSIDRLARDGIAVTEFVCRRLETDRIVLVGLSGGSMVGLNVVEAAPRPVLRLRRHRSDR